MDEGNAQAAAMADVQTVQTSPGGGGDQAAAETGATETAAASAETAGAEQANPAVQPEQNVGDSQLQQGDDRGLDNSADQESESTAADQAKDWDNLAEALAGSDGLDAELAASFVEFGKDQGLSVGQGKAVADWYLSKVLEAREKLTDQSVEALRKEWGAAAESNRQKANALIQRIDRMCNGALIRAINRSGIACDADFYRAMHAAAQLTAEDTLGGAGQSQPEPAPETALEGIMDVFKNAGA